MKCPKCGSDRIRHKDDEFESLNHGVKHGAAHGIGDAMKGHPGMLVIVGGAWLVNKAIKAISPTWTCKNCHHSFS